MRASPRRHGAHDRIFRHVFSKPVHARAALGRIVDEHLSHRIDWSTLRLVPGSFVEERLRGSLSDLLFSARLEDSDQEALIYVLWDHQSQPDELMPLRLLEYAVRALRAYTAEPDAIRGYVPVLVPVLLYQGPGPWPGPFQLTDLHMLHGEPGPAGFIELHMVIGDLSSLALDGLSVMARSTLQLMKMAALGTLDSYNAQQVAEWISEVHCEEGYSAFRALMEYVMLATKDDDMLDEVIEHANGDVKGDMMSLGEKLIARGWAKGHAKGHAEGRRKGLAAMLVQQLGHRFGKVPARARSRIRGASVSELERWGLRLLAAATLDEVFEEP